MDLETTAARLVGELTEQIELAGRRSDGRTGKDDFLVGRPDALRPGVDAEHLSLVRLAIDHSPEGVAVIRPEEGGRVPRVILVNESFCRLTGMGREEIVGQQLEIFGIPEADQAVRDALLHPLCRRKPFEGEAYAQRRSGARYTVELLLVPIHDPDGEVAYWVAYLKDVSERKAQMAALEKQARHDALTKLPNRSLLTERIDQAIETSRLTGSPMALMIMDLDRFKEINDTLGHHAGDLLLQEVALRLRREIQPPDTVGRLGGDEFAILLVDPGGADEALRTGRRVLTTLEEPIVLDGQRCEIGASIGVAIFPDHGVDADSLFRRADGAMYHAKRTGRGCLLDAPVQTRIDSAALSLSSELREAIANGQLRIYYQPKVHLRSGLVTRVEALVRWEHPSRGLLVPDHFIPLAERTGLIKPLTQWVLDNSLRQCRQWQDAGLPLQIAVNLSTRLLHDHVLPQTIAGLLDRWKVPPHCLKLEITESSILADPPHVLAILSLLQGLGVRLSLDDFGTGFSSLTHIRELPFDEIKIDKSFIMGMRSSVGDRAIVRATIELAHNLGRQVVAEGVDDHHTCRVLASLECDLAQGYSFSPPLPAGEFEAWLSATGWGFSVWREVLAR